MSLTTNRIKTTALTRIIVPASLGHVGGTAGGLMANDNGTVTFAQGGAGVWIIPVKELNVGDTIMRFTIRGATAGITAKTLAFSLMRTVSITGTITATSIMAATSDTTATAHAIDLETYLTTPEKVIDKAEYFVKCTMTTNGAGVTATLSSIEALVKKTFGQET